ncbi:hypothetical protein VCRA2113O207_460009 [Vibrio crassostreae]|nr:hypothetical protein VCRA2113O207_460009 [Vibrio crassostreae]
MYEKASGFWEKQAIVFDTLGLDVLIVSPPVTVDEVVPNVLVLNSP